jgi:HK97 family phage prohead protease
MFHGEIKAVEDGEAGEFEALASVFGNKDRWNEVVEPGAFVDSLADYAAKGLPVPVVWAHQSRDPFSHIGKTLEIKEVGPEHPMVPSGATGGLYYRGKLDIEDEKGNPVAKQVYLLLKEKRITQQSFHYSVIDGSFEKRDGEHIYVIKKAEIFEVGPCLAGVNSLTTTGAVKAAGDDELLKQWSPEVWQAISEIAEKAVSMAPKRGTEKSADDRHEGKPEGDDLNADKVGSGSDDDAIVRARLKALEIETSSSTMGN